MNFTEGIKNIFDSLLNIGTPKHFSMIEENNILGIYDQDLIVSKTENFIGAISLEGINYYDLDSGSIESLFIERINALNAISEEVEIKIITKRRKLEFNREYNHIKNSYAKRIINLWEGKEKVYTSSYFIIFETKNSNIKGFFEKKKIEITTSIKEDAGENNNTNITYINKQTLLSAVIQRVLHALSPLNPKKMNSIDLLRFYAEYINGIYIKFFPDNGILGDSYIASNVSFHKDYFIQDFNGQRIFNRFVAIKAYDSETTSSLPLSNILHLEAEFDVIINIDAISKDKAVSKITEKRRRASPLIKGQFDELKELVKSDRLLIQYISLMVLVKEKSKENLNLKSQEIANIFIKNGLVAINETINMLPTFFSFFPNKSKLNARKRLQVSRNIASMILFEKEHTGRDKNSWGNMPLSIFKNQSMSPFLFNFHAQEVKQAGDMVLGHTMIIGGTGAGKTTLMSFLIANCLKYDINILTLDRLYGMKIMTEFFDGEYNDGEEFYINPFTLEYKTENIAFLSSWLGFLIGLDENNPDDIEKIAAIEKAINDTYHNLYHQNITFGLSDIAEGILKTSDQHIQMQLTRYLKNPLFNSLKDSLSFEKQITCINMDFIVNSTKDASLIALYLFHKMIFEAKENAKGFFIFIDEAKSYTEIDTMIDKINLTLTQARKVNGVLALAFQDINQLDGVKNASSIVANMAHIILYPTRDIEKIKSYGINLTESEENFLLSANARDRKILLKNRLDGTSNILDVNLAKLGNYLNILSSSSHSVQKLKNLKNTYPNDYKERFLNGY
ncbi:DNA transfer protein [Helicobacter sp. 12S02232-10]|uniref:VirB4 family type IV secretion/conjugal transfer ATPase n=1 Tax=Helicobacter sp. 12S02232-10 TaxID=1476197 RepID=UPI000BA511C1|nr:DNA transfer protein [Helicobacter sp. 12S02232-10]PAF49449.1 DNA transfer protein [Helicobacter sp. 12S02232-10]